MRFSLSPLPTPVHKTLPVKIRLSKFQFLPIRAVTDESTMTNSVRVAAAQMTSINDLAANFSTCSRLVKANDVFGRLRPRQMNAESDEESMKREIYMLKATLAREREEHEAIFQTNEDLQMELAQARSDMRGTHEVLVSTREELKISKASEQKLADMNIRFAAETEYLKNKNEEITTAYQDLTIQSRADRKIHRSKRRKLRSKIKALQERDPPLTEEVRRQIQEDYRTSDELGAEIMKVYYEGYEDCRGRGKEKLTAAQLDPALLDLGDEGAA